MMILKGAGWCLGGGAGIAVVVEMYGEGIAEGSVTGRRGSSEEARMG